VVDAFQRRAGNPRVGRFGGVVGAAGGGGIHHGLAGLAHHGLHVFEADVHQARNMADVADVADVAHRVLQHVVGMREGCSCVTPSPNTPSSFSPGLTIRAKRKVQPQPQAVRSSVATHTALCGPAGF